ncbi:unnamed protein product, partial [Didymodactylos carnosus]
TLEQNDIYYMGPINSYEAFHTWINEKCVPLVREITFENAEELTDEGLPFLILFHDQNDHQIIADFEQEVAKQLMNERATINCLHADGQKFVHPLHHLGKSTSDLPLLTIDSFRHMFLFPNIKDLTVPGKLLEFVQNLHSGKLHQDFHNPPPPPTKEPGETTTIRPLLEKHDDVGSGDTQHLPKSPDISQTASPPSQQFIQQQKTNPPESVFIHLGPNFSLFHIREIFCLYFLFFSLIYIMKRHRQIALLGYPGVGKSTIAGQFVYKAFLEEYDPNIRTQLRHSHCVHGQEYDLLVIDNAGTDPYTINHGEFDNSDSYIIVYSIDDKSSFDMVPLIRDKIINNSASSKIPLVIVGNKIDRTSDRVVSTAQGQKLAEDFGVAFIETSAKDTAGVEKIFLKCIHAMDQDMNSGNDPVPSTTTPTKLTNSKTSKTSQSKESACTLS